jgi:hypothetical protein
MFNIEEFNAALDSPYMFHKGATHTVNECSQFKRVFLTTEDSKRPRGGGNQSSSRLYNNNRCDDRRGHGDDNRHDDPQPEDRRDECNLPPLPVTGNPNGPFQHTKSSINMIVGSLKAIVSRR